MTKEQEQIARIMQGLKCTEAEAKEIYEIDFAIDHGEAQDFDLPPEKQKIAQQFARTGTRKTVGKGEMKANGLRLVKRERKPNELKGLIISQIFSFLSENADISAEKVEITNKERQIAFSIGDRNFEFTLVEKRKPKN